MKPQIPLRKAAFVLTTAALTAAAAAAQDARPQGEGRRGQDFAGMQRVGGEVTAVSGSTITIKAEDGTVYQVVTTDNTRMMHVEGGGFRGMGGERGEGPRQAPTPIKVSDIHPADAIVAAGQMDAEHKTLHAAMLFDTDAATVKAMRANLGKTYITGRVTAIDMDKPSLTVERPDHVAQTIGLDEGTSFRRGGRGQYNAGNGASPGTAESITLADIKVGDNVSGQGAVKNGVFVPAQLIVMTPRPQRSPEAAAAPAAK